MSRSLLSVSLLFLAVGCSSPSHRHLRVDAGESIDGFIVVDQPDGSRRNTDASTPDMDTQPPTSGYGCNAIFDCASANCPTSSQACVQTCIDNASALGQSEFFDLDDCIAFACPSQRRSDPCYNQSSSTCSNCIDDAFILDCYFEADTCFSDL